MATASSNRALPSSSGSEDIESEYPELVLPTFIVIGAAKSGTTSLCEYARMHPRVFVSDPKEPQFFPVEFNWDRGVKWYAAHFSGGAGLPAVGEGSTTYTRYPHSKGVAERMFSLLPRAKLIYLVRHPIERMISQYQQHVWRGWEHERSIDRALRTNPFYTDISRYATQIEQYRQVFPPQQLLVITSERLKDDREAVMRQVFEFIDVDPNVTLPGLNRTFNPTHEKRMHRKIDAVLRRMPGYTIVAARIPEPIRKAKYYATTRRMGARPTISEALRRELEDRLRDEVVGLRPYMGPEFDGWGIA